MKEAKIKNNKELLNLLFKKYIHEDGFICGGFVRNCLLKLKTPVSSDIDIYCDSDESFTLIKERLMSYGYMVKKESPVSILFKCLLVGEFPIQLIKPLKKGHLVTTGSVEEIIQNFDFTVIRAGIYYIDGKIKAVVDDDFEEDNNKKRLKIKNIHCPIAEIFRVAKYIEKGFYLPPIETIKILEDWGQRSDEYKVNIVNTLLKESPTKEEIDTLEALLHID